MLTAFGRGGDRGRDDVDLLAAEEPVLTPVGIQGRHRVRSRALRSLAKKLDVSLAT